MVTKYRKFVICETCKGLGKVEKEFIEEDKPAVESNASTAIENSKSISTEVKKDAASK